MEVREAVSRNMGLLIASMEDTDKVSSLRDIIIRMTQDNSPTVSASAFEIPLPIICKWSRDMSVFFDSIVSPVTTQLENYVKV